jgi:predicted HicB family RNase H-like nuclease
MQTEHLSFRVSASLASALNRRAEQAGCSVSEYLRSIARERVGLQ